MNETKKVNQEEVELKKQIHLMSNTINEQAEEIQILKNKLNKLESINFKSMIDNEFLRIFKNFIFSPTSSSSPGILYILKKEEKNSFRNKTFIASSSQGDIFNLINPKTNDCFCTANCNKFFIEFILEEPVLIGGLEIYAENSHFPQSFDVDIDGKIIARIKQTMELNGPGKMMTVHFSPIHGRKVKIILTGPSLDQHDSFILFKRIEIMTVTAIAERPKEYFANLIELSENKDPHKCPVCINATAFDFNAFVALDSSKNIGINGPNSWFQIELTNGLAILTGCRILRCKDPNKLKSYKIICTNDIEKPISSWTTLLVIDEKSKNEHDILGVFRFQIQSPPVKYVRIVMTGPNWNNQFFLSFFHFDLFGIYF